MDQLWILGKGLPQGAKSSPKLFDIQIDDLIEPRMRSQVDLKDVYADDVIIVGWGIN